MKKNKLINQRILIADCPQIYIDTNDFEGKIEDVATHILNIRKRIADAIKLEPSKYKTPYELYEEIEIKSSAYDDSTFNVFAYRTETDAEAKERIKKAREKYQAQKNKVKERETELLKTLLKKYGVPR